MSAYIVSKEHITYLVQSALALSNAPRRSSHAFRWSYADPCRPGGWEHAEICCGDYDKAAEVANLIWQENIKSVSHRYPGESSGTLPGPIGGSFVVEPSDFAAYFEYPDPVQVLKSCDCLEYQSCEHPDWHASQALAFLDTLRKLAWTSLPSYDSKTWGAPEVRPTNAVRLSSLIRK